MASDVEDEDLLALRSAVLASMNNKKDESSSQKDDSDEDPELEALRLAALKTKKEKKQQIEKGSLPTPDTLNGPKAAPVPPVFRKNNRNNNLIVINTVPLEEESKNTDALVPNKHSTPAVKPVLIRPQDKWLASETSSVSSTPPRPKVSSKFSRFESSDSESGGSEDEDEEEDDQLKSPQHESSSSSSDSEDSDSQKSDEERENKSSSDDEGGNNANIVPSKDTDEENETDNEKGSANKVYNDNEDTCVKKSDNETSNIEPSENSGSESDPMSSGEYQVISELSESELEKDSKNGSQNSSRRHVHRQRTSDHQKIHANKDGHYRRHDLDKVRETKRRNSRSRSHERRDHREVHSWDRSRDSRVGHFSQRERDEGHNSRIRASARYKGSSPKNRETRRERSRERKPRELSRHHDRNLKSKTEERKTGKHEKDRDRLKSEKDNKPSKNDSSKDYKLSKKKTETGLKEPKDLQESGIDKKLTENKSSSEESESESESSDESSASLSDEDDAEEEAQPWRFKHTGKDKTREQIFERETTDIDLERRKRDLPGDKIDKALDDRRGGRWPRGHNEHRHGFDHNRPRHRTDRGPKRENVDRVKSERDPKRDFHERSNTDRDSKRNFSERTKTDSEKLSPSPTRTRRPYNAQGFQRRRPEFVDSTDSEEETKVPAIRSVMSIVKSEHLHKQAESRPPRKTDESVEKDKHEYKKAKHKDRRDGEGETRGKQENGDIRSTGHEAEKQNRKPKDARQILRQKRGIDSAIIEDKNKEDQGRKSPVINITFNKEHKIVKDESKPSISRLSIHQRLGQMAQKPAGLLTAKNRVKPTQEDRQKTKKLKGASGPTEVKALTDLEGETGMMKKSTVVKLKPDDSKDAVAIVKPSPIRFKEDVSKIVKTEKSSTVQLKSKKGRAETIDNIKINAKFSTKADSKVIEKNKTLVRLKNEEEAKPSVIKLKTKAETLSNVEDAVDARSVIRLTKNEDSSARPKIVSLKTSRFKKQKTDDSNEGDSSFVKDNFETSRSVVMNDDKDLRKTIIRTANKQDTRAAVVIHEDDDQRSSVVKKRSLWSTRTVQKDNDSVVKSSRSVYRIDENPRSAVMKSESSPSIVTLKRQSETSSGDGGTKRVRLVRKGFGKEKDAETNPELDAKIRQIQQRNAAILKRKLEIEQDKQTYG